MELVEIIDLIDFTKSSLWWAILIIAGIPTMWNIVARTEYNTHFLTKLFGGPYRGCYALAAWILICTSYRVVVYDYRYHGKIKISLDSLLTTTKTKKKESLMQLTTKKYWNYQSNISSH